MKYRKKFLIDLIDGLQGRKPEEIEAVHWDGTNYQEILKFAGKRVYKVHSQSSTLIADMFPNGYMLAKRGCYIIRDGETYYPCDEDIFNMIYEPVK